MGKCIAQSKAEVLKCAAHCKYYEENTERILKTKHIETATTNSYVLYQPTGPILLIEPWNFPFWMPFRTAIPQLALGNTVLYKPAPNISMSADLLENAMVDSGLENIFKNVYFEPENTEFILSNHKVQGVGFTGSTGAGKAIASIAGKYIKKSLLELGGSDAFIILDDADVDKAAQNGSFSRLNNNGQACINAKRFIAHESVYEDVKEKIIGYYEKLVIGDPSDETTTLGPVARSDLHENLRQQVLGAVNAGADLAYGNLEKIQRPAVESEGWFFDPVIVENISSDNPAYREEFFGPAIQLYKAANEQAAIDLGTFSHNFI